MFLSEKWFVLLQELKSVGTAQSKNAALAVANKGKNRESNVLPCKQTNYCLLYPPHGCGISRC